MSASVRTPGRAPVPPEDAAWFDSARLAHVDRVAAKIVAVQLDQPFRLEQAMNKYKEYTRQELYDLVWSTPMVKFAKEFGLSDVGLRKTCVKYNIPTPPLGYWAKLNFGELGSNPLRGLHRRPAGLGGIRAG
jgi:hypothetical protein